MLIRPCKSVQTMTTHHNVKSLGDSITDVFAVSGYNRDSVFAVLEAYHRPGDSLTTVTGHRDLLLGLFGCGEVGAEMLTVVTQKKVHLHLGTNRYTFTWV